MDISSDARLKRAIEGLYATFSRYPLREHVDGCPCCVDDEDHALLYSGDLRHIGPFELERYAFKAMSTWGDTDDFRHFLPRLFELLLVDGPLQDWSGWTIGPVLLHKLSYGQWLTWPEDERRAVTAFLDAAWLNILGRFPHDIDAGSFLRGAAEARDDASRYLATWRIADSLPAARHFAEFVETHPIGWPADRPKAADQITAWLRDPARKAELERAFFTFGTGDRETAAALSKAVDTLAAIG